MGIFKIISGYDHRKPTVLSYRYYTTILITTKGMNQIETEIKGAKYNLVTTL